MSLSAACLLVLAVPDLLGWVVAALASNLAMLHTSRLLAGTAAGGYILCIQVPWWRSLEVTTGHCGRCTWVS